MTRPPLHTFTHTNQLRAAINYTPLKNKNLVLRLNFQI